MRWSDCAVQDLRRYTGLSTGVVNIKDRISSLEARFEYTSGSDMSSLHSGAGEAHDSILLDNIAERERLRLLLEADSRLLRTIERGLAGLNDKERKVLDRFFINKQKNHVERLMEELGVEQSTVYRIKEQALYKFTVSMYGITEY